VAETDSAGNHYGKLRAENPRHYLRYCGPCLPLAFLWSSGQESDHEYL